MTGLEVQRGEFPGVLKEKAARRALVHLCNISLMSRYPIDRIGNILILNSAVSLSYRVSMCHKATRHLVLDASGGFLTTVTVQIVRQAYLP